MAVGIGTLAVVIGQGMAEVCLAGVGVALQDQDSLAHGGVFSWQGEWEGTIFSLDAEETLRPIRYQGPYRRRWDLSYREKREQQGEIDTSWECGFRQEHSRQESDCQAVGGLPVAG
ncbi:hypothetical protein HME01_32080 [Vreelandella aquamarina]|nr:hypothetical protein HME01_32080 [Halomonas meridiana]